MYIIIRMVKSYNKKVKVGGEGGNTTQPPSQHTIHNFVAPTKLIINKTGEKVSINHEQSPQKIV